ncbi:sigma 54-interacting transcriptional regulator, partial [Siminovitchia fortis]|uniref:sigma 54-interacting transcriptional regulator n=1 Tax=Siminovitchia fortis TaxID=254758 RepID=UPI0036F287F3
MQSLPPLHSTLLITPQSPLPKQLIPPTIHQFTNPPSPSFLPINSPPIPQHLIQTELFAHQKAPFTGPHSK